MTDQRVVELVRKGVQPSELDRLILSAPQVHFDLTPAAEQQMMQAGVSEETIKTMAQRQSGLAQAATVSSLRPIASVPVETAKASHTKRNWIIFGVAAAFAGGAAYGAYRLANPHHCTPNYTIGTVVTNPAAQMPTCN